MESGEEEEAAETLPDENWKLEVGIHHFSRGALPVKRPTEDPQYGSHTWFTGGDVAKVAAETMDWCGNFLLSGLARSSQCLEG